MLFCDLNNWGCFISCFVVEEQYLARSFICLQGGGGVARTPPYEKGHGGLELRLSLLQRMG